MAGEGGLEGEVSGCASGKESGGVGRGADFRYAVVSNNVMSISHLLLLATQELNTDIVCLRARNNATFAKHAHPWPGLLLKKADMAPYNTNRSALDRRSLIYYSAIGAMPSLASDPNLHACAHLYASDVNSLLMVAAHTGLEGSYSQMASLSQTVLLHTGVGGFDVGDDGQGRKWYVLEVRADRLEDGRATHKSRIWREGDGLHVGSTMQDGLIRLRFQDEEEAERARRGLRGVPVWDAKL